MKGHALVSAVSYSLRYDKHHSNPTCAENPTKVINLWKSCVLPHFLLYLRYIHSDSQIQKLQACLNRSFSSTLHVYGHATALLAEVGIPPLHITQNLQLVQFRYRLSTHEPSRTTTQWGEECTKLFVRWTEIESTHTPLCPHQCSKPNRRTAKNHTERSWRSCVLNNGCSTSSPNYSAPQVG